MDMMMMQMWFEATTHVTLWFKSWKISSPLWYAVSCIGLFALCILQEALGRWRAAYARSLRSSGKSVDASAHQENGHSSRENAPLIGSSPPPQQTGRLLLCLAYGANVTTSYLLMLAVMTFNVGYFVTIVAGLTVGHYLMASVPLEGTVGGLLSELCCAQPNA